MCGIAGILQSGPDLPHWEASLLRMREALRHRGPDDEGVFDSVRTNSRCGLVHTRLSILDLSAAGHQPMSTTDGRYSITFNGEIYNFHELRRALAAEGVEFRSQTDTEIILHLYEREGPACLDRLQGMFAFAIWDAQEERCFIARDPLGIKPLYFYQKGANLLFASELRALLASGEVPRQLSLLALDRYFRTGSVPDPDSLIAGVHHLPAGHYLIWHRGQVETKSYWRLRFDPREENAAQAPALARAALLESLQRHFVSDVPVGIFLSSGLDSTALVALAQQFDLKELSTFSISFAEAQFNEGDAARRTADFFGARHFDWRLDAPTASGLFEDFIARMDTPSIDGFNTFCVSKHAHNQGMKVVLSGLGGDELFGGYSSFRNVPRLYRTSHNLPVPLRTTAGQWLETHASRSNYRRLGNYLQQTPSMPGAYAAYRGIFTGTESDRLVRHYTGLTPSPTTPGSELPHDPTLEDTVSRLELENYMRFQLLRDSDTMSMAWGLELRVPFVDRRLLESLATIPAAQRLAVKKALLRQAVPEIPEWIARRPKQGFSFPFQDWFGAQWSSELGQVGQGSGVRVQTWYQKWSLLVIRRWCEKMHISLSDAIA